MRRGSRSLGLAGNGSRSLGLEAFLESETPLGLEGILFLLLPGLAPRFCFIRIRTCSLIDCYHILLPSLSYTNGPFSASWTRITAPFRPLSPMADLAAVLHCVACGESCACTVQCLGVVWRVEGGGARIQG